MTISGFGWRDLSTDAVAAADRLDYWREATNSLFPPTRLRRSGAEGFYGRVAWLGIGDVTLADIVSTSVEVHRTERDIGAGDDRWYEMTIQVEGDCAFTQDGRDLVTTPRSMVLYDSRRPYAMRFGGPYRQISLKVPRAALRERVPGVDALVARLIRADTLPGRFLHDLAAALCDRPGDLAPGLAPRLESHVLELTATALLGLSGDDDRSASGHALRDRVRAGILARLDDPDLGPRQIAEANDISLRRLYELFGDEEESVAGFVQTQRLERIRRELADPLMRGLPIATIALRRGFKDVSHFSRAFRRRYGVSPREWRAGQAHAGS